MAQILVRNIEESVKETLRSQAKAHGRSLEDLVRDLLRAAANMPPEEGLGTRIVRLVRECGEVFPQFEEVHYATREPPDFSGPEYGTYEADP